LRFFFILLANPVLRNLRPGLRAINRPMLQSNRLRVFSIKKSNKWCGSSAGRSASFDVDILGCEDRFFNIGFDVIVPIIIKGIGRKFFAKREPFQTVLELWSINVIP
jgi:hypothetical protein